MAQQAQSPIQQQGTQISSPQQQGTQISSPQQQGTQFSSLQRGAQQVGSQQQGLRLQDVQTPQEKAAIDSINRAVEVCEWCADQCIQSADPNMVECIRLCEDVSELGEVLSVLLPRKSRVSGQVLRAFEQSVQACAQECGRFQHAHCQECASVLGQTYSTIQPLLQTGGQQVQTQHQRPTGSAQIQPHSSFTQ